MRLVFYQIYIALYLVHSIIADSCDKFCSDCNTITQSCNACYEGFTLNPSTKICQSNCTFGQMLQINTKECVSICPEGYFSNQTNLACEKLKQCPILEEFGQELFDTFSQVVITKKYIVIRGLINGSTYKNLKVLDLETHSYIGEMSLHQEGVINMILITDANTDYEYLISISSSEIIKWDINFGIALKAGIFPSAIIGVEKVSYIDEKYLILIYNDTNFLQFALVNIKDFFESSNNINQLTQSELSSAPQVDYKLFYKVHTKPLVGFFILNNLIYSYAQDGLLLEWSIQTNIMNKKISENNFALTNVYCDAISQTFIIKKNQSQNFIKCTSSSCIEVPTSHTQQINKIILSYLTTTQNQSILLTFSTSELNLYTLDKNSQLQFIQTINISSFYRFINNNILALIQEDGTLIVYQVSLQPSNGLDYIQQIGKKQKKILRFTKTIDLLVIEKTSKYELITVSNNVLNFFNSIKEPSTVNQNAVVTQDSKRQLSLKYRYHQDDVNGILIDSFYNRVITYGKDGSFRIWETVDAQNSDLRLLLVQFHPSCPLYLEGACNFDLTIMKILRNDLLLTQYNDNILYLWTYQQFSVTLNIKLQLDRTDIPILNTHFFQKQYLLFVNQAQIKVFNVQTFNMDTNVSGSYRFACMDLLKGVYTIIYLDTIKYKFVFCNYPLCPATSKGVNFSYNRIIALQFFDVAQQIVLSTDNNKITIIQTTSLTTRSQSVNPSNFVSMKPDAAAPNMYIFSQNYTISYSQFAVIPPNVLPSYTVQSSFSFSSSIEKEPITFSNPELHFFFVNTVVGQVQNQVICLGQNFNSQFLITFSDKISSINVDLTNQIIYISFSNGKLVSRYFTLPQYYYKEQVSYKQLVYSSSLKKLFALSNNINQINSIQWNTEYSYSGVHSNNLVGMIVDEQNKFIVSYSEGGTNNLVKWSLDDHSYQIFQNGHSDTIKNVFLDTLNDILITFSVDYYIIVWKYSTQQVIYKIDSHYQDKLQLDQTQIGIPVDLQTVLTVTAIIHDKGQQRIFSMNNLNKIYSHYYLKQTMTLVNIPNIQQLYIEQEDPYKCIIAIVKDNYVWLIEKYDYTNHQLISQHTYHSNKINGIQFKNQKAYSFEDTLIAVMDRKTLELINTITCQNPLISQFIVFEKMNYVFIYSDAQQEVINTRIGVYMLTGEKVTDIISAQQIEQGNIAKVVLDEDAYQLIFFRQTTFYGYTVDIRTFKHSNYLPIIYNTYIYDVIVLPQSNAIIYRDSANLNVYPYQMSLNLNNNMKEITQPSQLDYFINSDTQQVFLIDCENVAWRYDRLNKNSIQELYEFDIVQKTQYQANHFYVFTINQIMIFDNNFTLIKTFDYSVIEIQFTSKYLFFTSTTNIIFNINLSTFQFGSLNQYLGNKVNQILVNEEYNEVFLLQSQLKVFIINYETNIIKSQITTTVITKIFYDSINKIVLNCIGSGQLIAYQQYNIGTTDYTQNPSLLFNGVSGVKTILFEMAKNRIYIYYIVNKLPLVKVFSYSINQSTALLNPLSEIGVVPVPSDDPSVKLMIVLDMFIIQSLYQISIYSSETLALKSIERDNMIFQTTKLVQLFDYHQNLYYLQSSNGLSLIQYKSAHFELKISFPLSQPSIINISENSIYDFMEMNLYGISVGKIFNYNFNIDSSNVLQTNELGYDDDKCFLQLPSFSAHFQFKSYLQKVINSFSQLQITQDQTFFQIDISNQPFYDQLLKNLNGSLVYTQESRIKLVLMENSFAFNQLNTLNFDNFEFDTSQVNTSIVFSKQTQNVVFRNIQIKTDINGLSFEFHSLEKVILEDIVIEDVNLIQSQLFSFINVKEVLVKDIVIKNIKKTIDSSLFIIKGSTKISFENIVITQITNIEDSRRILVNGINSNIKNQTLIYIENAQDVYFNTFTIDNCFSSNPSTIILSMGVLNTQFQQITYLNSTAYQLLKWVSTYDQDNKSYLLNSTQVLINQITAKNVTQLFYSLLFLQGSQATIQTTEFTQIECSSCQGTVFQMVQLQILKMVFSQFTFNKGKSGGAIAMFDCQGKGGLIDNQIVIKSSLIEQNQAKESGGGIYLSNTDIDIIDTSISFNEALIGGGVRYLVIQPTFVQKNKLYQETKDQEYNGKNKIMFNHATIHSMDIGSHLHHITITSSDQVQFDSSSILKELTSDVDQSKLQVSEGIVYEFRSGANVKLQIQLVDEDGIPAYFDISSYKNGLYPQSIKSELDSYSIKIAIPDNSIKLFGQQTSDYVNYNQEKRSFLIEGMMVIANPETQNYITVQSPAIQRPLYDTLTGNKIFIQNLFYMKIKFNFRSCIPGELFRKSGSLFFCQECLEGTYSVITPSKENYITESCEKCPEEASFCYRNQMSLKNGYWKASNSSDRIISCENKKTNCNGDQNRNYCLEGHIGPLCEICDIKGVVWDKQYATDGSYNCLSCALVTQAKYLIPTILLITGMVFYIALSIKIALQISRQIVTGYYLRMMSIIPVSKSSFMDTTNMNIKQLINYIQLSQLVNTVKVELPTIVTFFPTFVGSPVQNMKYTLDCWLNQFQYQDFPIVYSRTLWTLMIPVIYLVGITVIYVFFIVIRYTKLQSSSIQSGLVFLFFFIQPNMIQNLLQVMSCRQIDGILYIQADVSFECYSYQHLKFLGFICIPGFIIWAVLIPGFILRKMINNKKRLETSSIRLRFGFLYQDYKQKTYYWEFIRIYLKLIILCILNFYGDPYTNKLVFALVAIIFYMVLLTKKKPFQMAYFLEIDKKSMMVVIILIIMNIFLYNNPPYAEQVIFYIILLGIHNLYIVYLFWEVAKAKVQISYRRQYMFVKKKLVEWFPALKDLLYEPKPITFKAYVNWKKLRVIFTTERQKLTEQVKDQIFGLTSFSNKDQRKIQSSLNPHCTTSSYIARDQKASTYNTYQNYRQSSVGVPEYLQFGNSKQFNQSVAVQQDQLSIIEDIKLHSQFLGVDAYYNSQFYNQVLHHSQFDKRDGSIFRNLRKVSDIYSSDSNGSYRDQHKQSSEGISHSNTLKKALTIHIEEQDSEQTTIKGGSSQDIVSLQNIREDRINSPPKISYVKTKNQNNSNDKFAYLSPDSDLVVPSYISTINLSSKNSKLSLHFNEDQSHLRSKRFTDCHLKSTNNSDVFLNNGIESKHNFSFSNQYDVNEDVNQRKRGKSLVIPRNRFNSNDQTHKKSPYVSSQKPPSSLEGDFNQFDSTNYIQIRSKEFSSIFNQSKQQSLIEYDDVSEVSEISRNSNTTSKYRRPPLSRYSQAIHETEESSLSCSNNDALSSFNGQLDSPPPNFNYNLSRSPFTSSRTKDNNSQEESDEYQSPNTNLINSHNKSPFNPMDKKQKPMQMKLKILTKSNSLNDEPSKLESFNCDQLSNQRRISQANIFKRDTIEKQVPLTSNQTSEHKQEQITKNLQNCQRILQEFISEIQSDKSLTSPKINQSKESSLIVNFDDQSDGFKPQNNQTPHSLTKGIQEDNRPSIFRTFQRQEQHNNEDSSIKQTSDSQRGLEKNVQIK